MKQQTFEHGGNSAGDGATIPLQSSLHLESFLQTLHAFTQDDNTHKSTLSKTSVQANDLSSSLHFTSEARQSTYEILELALKYADEINDLMPLSDDGSSETSQRSHR